MIAEAPHDLRFRHVAADLDAGKVGGREQSSLGVDGEERMPGSMAVDDGVPDRLKVDERGDDAQESPAGDDRRGEDERGAPRIAGDEQRIGVGRGLRSDLATILEALRRGAKAGEERGFETLGNRLYAPGIHDAPAEVGKPEVAHALVQDVVEHPANRVVPDAYRARANRRQGTGGADELRPQRFDVNVDLARNRGREEELVLLLRGLERLAVPVDQPPRDGRQRRQRDEREHGEQQVDHAHAAPERRRGGRFFAALPSEHDGRSSVWMPGRNIGSCPGTVHAAGGAPVGPRRAT